MASKAVAKVNAEIRNRLKTMQGIEDDGARKFVTKLDELRRQVVMAVANEQEITAYTSRSIKDNIVDLVERFRPGLEEQLTEAQRKQFVKGIQLIDAVLKTSDLNVAIPFLSEQLLEQAKAFGAELVTGITNDARKRIATEIDLAVMGQKPVTDVIKSIGKNLTDSSVFGTVAKRAETIYRTEVSRMSNMATINRMKQSHGQVPDLEKRWLHSHIGIPRPGHLALDNVQIPLLEKFSLLSKDGVVYKVEGPQDPILPAGEVVNCKCHAIPVVGRLEK